MYALSGQAILMFVNGTYMYENEICPLPQNPYYTTILTI